MTTKQNELVLSESAVERFFDFHVDVLKGLLAGESLDAILEEHPRESERYNYRQLTRTLSLLSFDDAGNLRGAYPISPAETPYRITVDGVGTGHAMCAIDSLGVAYLFGAPTLIESSDPVSGRTIRITVDPEKLDTASYSHIQVTVPKTMPKKAEGEGLDAAVDLCPLIGFVESEESIPDEQREILTIIPFEQAITLGEMNFDRNNLKTHITAFLATLIALSERGPASADNLADLFLKSANPMLSSLPEEQARQLALGQIMGKGLVEKASEDESGEPLYDLTSEARDILSRFVN